MNRVVVAPVRDAELDAILTIERQAFSDPWSLESFQRILGNPAVFFASARGDDDLCVRGYVVAWFVADEGEIANLAVVPSVWGTGIGSKLLDATLVEARGRRAAAVYLEVRDSNERARKLYRSRGFEEVTRRRDYYRRPREDAIVLRRNLG